MRNYDIPRKDKIWENLLLVDLLDNTPIEKATYQQQNIYISQEQEEYSTSL